MIDTILVVDDERDILDLLVHHLESGGFSVITAETGEEALAQARTRHPAAILLDVMLPDFQGTDVLRLLRQEPATRSIPIILLTARGEEVDRVVGFELGADDYVVKPFSPREIVLRVQALLRRSAPADAADTVREAHGIRLDPTRHEVSVEGSRLELTATEFRLLEYLMTRPGRVLSRVQLLEEVWGSDVFVTDRTVDTHVKRLRSKLESAASAVETVRGVGYRFRRT